MAEGSPKTPMITCPRCGHAHTPPARGSFVAVRCDGCGVKLGWRRRTPDKVEVLAEAEPKAEPKPKAETPSPGGGLMKIISCPDCGKQLRFPTDRGHIRFNCSGCGSQLEWSPPGAGGSAAQNQSYGIFGGVTAQPAAQAKPQPTPQPAPQAQPRPQPRPAPAASDGPEPRSASLYWLFLAAGAAFGAKWCYEAAMEDEIWATAAILLTLLVPYFTYGAILRLTRWSAGMATAVTCALLLSLTMIVPYLQEYGIGGVMDGLGDLTADTGDEGSHFEGRTAKNTSQKDMNELMEGWE